MKLLHAICFSFLIGQSIAVYKRWKPDTNFENPNNWNMKRAPCGNDVVIIHDESPVVYVQQNTTVKEMGLPRNGELLLGRNVFLAFSSQHVEDCPDADGDLEFNAVHPEPWFDPINWCTSPTERGKCTSGKSQLDVEKVPCTFDSVVFPRGHGFYLDLSENIFNTTVKSLKVMGSTFTTSTLSNFTQDPEGKLMFKLPDDGGTTPVVQISRKSCEDREGCACGNDKPEITKKICDYGKNSCKRPRCRDTIHPRGGCCRLCGAIFNVSKGYGFDFKEFDSNMRNDFFASASEVSAIVSVMGEGWIQMVLYDETGEKSQKLAKGVKEAFEKDLANGGHKYAIKSFQVSLATKEPDAVTGPSSSLGSNSIAGIVIGVIIAFLIIAFIVLVFVYRRNGYALPSLPSMPSLPAMPPLPRNLVPARWRTTRDTSTPQVAPHVDPGFANPMYDSAPFDDSYPQFTMREMENLGAMKEEQPQFESAGFQNPMYGKKKTGPPFSDPSKADLPSGSEATSSGVATIPCSSASTGPSAAPAGKVVTGTLVDFDAGDINTDSTI